MALRPPAFVTAPAHEDASVLRFDDAPEFHSDRPGEAHLESMDLQVREAQERLSKLRAEQEELEHQRKILEVLKQKQERFISGRKDLNDKLERSLRAIDDELAESRRRVEELAVTQQEFQASLEDLRAFLPERWHRSQLDQELDRALATLIDAEAGFEKGLRRITSQRSSRTSELEQLAAEDETAQGAGRQPASSVDADDVANWLRRGFAFTLPLIVTLLVVLILAKFLF